MDVVVRPAGSSGTTWSLKDRLDRPLGTLAQDENGMFEITPDPRGGLMSISRTHKTLDAALSAIATHIKGACTLVSQMQD